MRQNHSTTRRSLQGRSRGTTPPDPADHQFCRAAHRRLLSYRPRHRTNRMRINRKPSRSTPSCYRSIRDTMGARVHSETNRNIASKASKTIAH